MGLRRWLPQAMAIAAGVVLYSRALPAVNFTGTELLGRPTDTSVALSVIADTPVEAYVEYGTSSGSYTAQTPSAACAAGTPVVIALEGLQPDTRYYYRLRYRETGAAEFAARPEHAFHTQRARGEAFTFTIQADPHLGDPNTDEGLYRVELQNAAADNPDFHVDLGDTFMTEKYGSSCADAVAFCLAHRPFFGIVGASAPVLLTNGNHEAELGWLRDGTEASLAVCSTLARRKYYPCPVPGGFYSGGSTAEPYTGIRDGYYAWEWGDALFVVLDPFWYTAVKPTSSGDGWSWTLGEDQYAWLQRTLEGSAARYKFVFVHNLVGGQGLEARGGIEGAGFYEWGGANADGSPGFAQHRPGWAKPIHQLLVDNGVSAVFHGHDHIFVQQQLDGIVYQECPRPDLPRYTDTSMAQEYGYVHGTVLPNAGHLRVTVSQASAKVEYVRAYLAGDGTNGAVASTYTIQSPAPWASFSVSPESPRAGEIATFTDQSGNGPAAWSWDFGDGSSSALQNPTHAYAEAGTYTVRLTVSNGHGSGTATRSLTVAPSCSVASVAAATSPFRLKVDGTNFESGCSVLVNGQSAPATDYKSSAQVVAQGAGLKAMVPKGAPVRIAVRNPDGGTSAPFTYVR